MNLKLHAARNGLTAAALIATLTLPLHAAPAGGPPDGKDGRDGCPAEFRGPPDAAAPPPEFDGHGEMPGGRSHHGVGPGAFGPGAFGPGAFGPGPFGPGPFGADPFAFGPRPFDSGPRGPDALGPPGAGDRPPPYLRGMQLSEAQQDKIFAILHAAAPTLREQFKAARKAHDALRGLARNAQFDVSAATALLQAQAKADSQVELTRLRTEHDVYLVLTPEQRSRLAARDEHHRDHDQSPGDDAPPRDGPPR